MQHESSEHPQIERHGAEHPHVLPYAGSPFLWPLIMTASASEAAASMLSDFAHRLVDDEAEHVSPPEPQWTTANRMALQTTTMRLRDFSTTRDGPATLICAPFALHGATIADFAPGHSLLETLLAAGIGHLYVTEWRSATPEMRYLSIDSYLAELNVAVDEIGAPVDLIGLCQGGWLALIYAARFPDKVRRLVLAGAPIDIAAGQSNISRITAEIPVGQFEEIVHIGGGRVIGHRVLELWGNTLSAQEADRVLQITPAIGVDTVLALMARFRAWDAWTVDLPGTYYLEVVSWLYKENRIAEGRFVALGRTINLADVDVPIFLLAGRDDELVAPAQLLATADLVATPKKAIETIIEPCGHLSLFMGAETLRRAWTRIARWLACDLDLAAAS